MGAWTNIGTTTHGGSIPPPPPLDNILGDGDDCKSCGIGQPAFRSYHVVMWIVVDVGVARPQVQVHKVHHVRSLKGWTPTDQQHYDKFRDTTTKALRELRREGGRTEASSRYGDSDAGKLDAEVAEAVIASAARQHGQGGSGAGPGATTKPTCPRSLRILEGTASKSNTDQKQRRMEETCQEREAQVAGGFGDLATAAQGDL